MSFKIINSLNTMKEEYIEIVDENNKKIGENKLRSLVHSSDLWHRIVHIYFFRISTEDIELLVYLRSSINDVDPNKWDARFGGHIRMGESLEQAVTREIKEEVGLSISMNDLIEGEWRKRNDPKNEFTKAYYFEYKGSSEELDFNDKEVQEVKWMFVADIENSMKKEPEIWSGKPDGLKGAIDFLKVNILGDEKT